MKSATHTSFAALMSRVRGHGLLLPNVLWPWMLKYLCDTEVWPENSELDTWKLYQVLERNREAGQPVPSDEILAHIAPIAFRHINFQGIYRFPLERYLDRLLPSVFPSKDRRGRQLTYPQETATFGTFR